MVGIVSPWNFPLLLSLFDAIPALLAGCAVAIKPSKITPRFIQPLVGPAGAFALPPTVLPVDGKLFFFQRSAKGSYNARGYSEVNTVALDLNGVERIPFLWLFPQFLTLKLGRIHPQ